jgi:hypothetical protein
MVVWPVSWCCLLTHGTPSHTITTVWFEHVKQSATLLVAHAGMVCEASWLLLPVDMQDRVDTHQASASEYTSKDIDCIFG